MEHLEQLVDEMTQFGSTTTNLVYSPSRTAARRDHRLTSELVARLR
jgi:hypothetical protein